MPYDDELYDMTSHSEHLCAYSDTLAVRRVLLRACGPSPLRNYGPELGYLP